MKAKTTIGALVSASLMLAAACGSDENPSPSSSAGGSGGTSVSASKGGHSSSSGGTFDFLPSGGAASGIDTSRCLPVELAQPYYTYYAPDFFNVLFDAYIGSEFEIGSILLTNPKEGTYDLSTATNIDAATCTECVGITHYRDDGTRVDYQALSGELTLDKLSLPDDSLNAGSVSQVVLREIVYDFDKNQQTVVPNGKCLVMDDTSWKTAVCNIGGHDCPDQMQCMATSYSVGGACLIPGTHQVGETCDMHKTASDCELGLTCGSGECLEICDFWNASAPCPGTQLCNAFSECVGHLADSAAIGEVCSKGEGWYCGEEDGRYAGQCMNTGNEILCERLCRTAESGDCVAFQQCIPMYQDASYGTCVAQ